MKDNESYEVGVSLARLSRKVADNPNGPFHQELKDVLVAIKAVSPEFDMLQAALGGLKESIDLDNSVW